MTETKLDAAQLVRQCASTQDPALLEELRARSREVLSLIDEADIEFSPEELEGFEKDCTGLGAVIALLAAADAADPDIPG
jgi:hypothetical protein